MENQQGIEHRKYVRVSSVFPVEFYLITGIEEVKQTYDIIQGFTRDVGLGGLCIEVNNLKDEIVRNVKSDAVKLGLTLHIPLREHTNAIARVVWIKCVKEDYPNRYLIGVSYEEIQDEARRRIIRYARSTRIIPGVAVGLIVVLLLAASGLFIYNQTERRKSEEMAKALLSALQTKGQLEEKIGRLDKDKAYLEERLKVGSGSIESLKAQIARTEEVAEEQKRLKEELILTMKEQERLKLQLNELVTQKASLTGELVSAKAVKAGLEQRGLQEMYSWLKVHQNPKTGLIISYEGDPALKDVAFTYDQALMVQCLLYYGDIDAAKRCIDFYASRAKRISGGFANAYDAISGDIAEPIVHTGPNMWIGLSAIKYFLKSQDKQYIPLAMSIADWAIELQRDDPDGGLRGGPNVQWFSTEHNLDAYAFFYILAKATNDARYSDVSYRVFEWLKKYGHNRQENRFNRGKGDSTIATDTLAWAIAAIGPERLQEEGLDPDRILEFAEDECRVKTTFIRPTKDVIEVTGFDFTKASNIARGGIISSEWTGQMIVAYKIMSDFYNLRGEVERAEIYLRKAKFYEEELDKLIITSPCKAGHKGWALPYATQNDVETGHGWRTAKGSQTGSTSATIYGIFAKVGYNPLGPE